MQGRMGQLAGAQRKADDTEERKINSKAKILRKAASARTGKPGFPKDALQQSPYGQAQAR